MHGVNGINGIQGGNGVHGVYSKDICKRRSKGKKVK